LTGRPSRTVVVLELCALAVATGVAVASAGSGDWDLPLIGALVALSLASDRSAIQSAANRVKIAGSFLAIVVAAVFAGATPAALIGVVTIGVGWAFQRYPREDLLINLVTYSWFPLIGGILFHESVQALGIEQGDADFYLLVLGLFVVALAIDTLLIAGYSAYVEGGHITTKARRMLGPVLPSELASAALAVGFAAAYIELGLVSLVLFAAVLLIFQYLIGALLLSQERADELELRAKQLAGFQVALLSALLRTLDLRDRMTARHSAAVARYSREMAIAAGLPEEQQDLVHTAALLHDIGKFVLPDRILKGNTTLSEADWEQIRKHPEEGARIVSQIDGYRPVGEVILAHHERIDGHGYPRALAGDEIPELARVIAVADTYDVMTARDSYRDPISSYDAITELRRVAGTQLDRHYVEVFIKVLADKDLAYRHGEDADFERELALDRRIHDYVATDAAPDRLGPNRARG
jgi:putative nucleotidyltransferase with HDIG domain